tara:strand:- start:264 stop:1037 length:774 start_codon:yes stop_codon:yes gene_type:complete
MSYTGFIKGLSGFLKGIDSPAVLEVGVDLGQSAFPLVHNLCYNHHEFLFEGVDISLKGWLSDSMSQLDGVNATTIKCNDSSGYFKGEPFKEFNVRFYETNSLSFLPEAVSCGKKYDLILLDGDHNYYTVYRELQSISHLCHSSTLIICDDFNGKHSKNDLFYSERPEYKDVKNATEKIVSKKTGVQNAIMDFVEDDSKDWHGHCIESQGRILEPVILYQSSFIDLKTIDNGNDNSSNLDIVVTPLSSCAEKRFKTKV